MSLLLQLHACSSCGCCSYSAAGDDDDDGDGLQGISFFCWGCLRSISLLGDMSLLKYVRPGRNKGGAAQKPPPGRRS
jgi:hypothetical protein